MALDDRVFPSGFKKSSSWSPFQDPRRPFVLPLNDWGAAKTMESDSCISVTVTDIPDEKETRKELFVGRDTAKEPLTLSLTFVKVL